MQLCFDIFVQSEDVLQLLAVIALLFGRMVLILSRCRFSFFVLGVLCSMCVCGPILLLCFYKQ